MSVAAHDGRLAREMEAVGYPPSVLDKARAGYWSDFKSEIAFPKIELVKMLQRDGHPELADRVVAGEFDG